MSEQSLACGVIGLGAMGAPMARRLARAGLLRGVWNRTPSRAQAVAADTGVAIAESPAALARQCQLVLLSVSADADVEQVIELLLPGAHAELVVVDTSTVAVDSARRAAARLAERGARFLDAPVSGGVEGAHDGRLAMMVGGDAAVVESARPALAALSARIVHMGPVGNGQAAKAVNQLMAAGIIQAVSEALAFGAAMKLPMDKLIEAISQGAAGSWFLTHRGASMTEGRFAPGFRVALHHKDLKLCQAMAEQLGAQLPLVEMTLVHYRRLIDEGFGDEDISALYRQKQRLFSSDE
jgi:3-hydroxyisobutyrate dehydrogenase